jgi:hypothetical protein
VTAISPARGFATGGTAVTITGTGFSAGATIVTIGGITATNIQVQSSTSLTATTIAGPAGAADVVATVGGQSGRLVGAFTYVGDVSVTVLAYPSPWRNIVFWGCENTAYLANMRAAR